MANLWDERFVSELPEPTSLQGNQPQEDPIWQLQRPPCVLGACSIDTGPKSLERLCSVH